MTDAAATPAPLTLGTAGHIDHGKTALVAALTGVDTDRLPEERARGMTIELGFAPLELPSGRRLSVVDVPGHERFVRTMVAGASGIDLYLMVVAADDGVMPQTREHAAVLAGLGIDRGVIAITKSDLTDPELALLEATELLPNTPAVAVSARTGQGLDELRQALDDVAAQVASRAGGEGPTRLHLDRVFSIRGAGTVVTGTLWAGSIGRGDELVVLPAGRRARVRQVQVHDRPVERAAAGQRVAVNLVGLEVRDLERGDVLAGSGANLRPSYYLDVALDVRLEHGTRLHVHHGTREVPARVAPLGGRFHQLRLEHPLVAHRGDRIVLRQIAPPDTLGGGTVLDPTPRRHGATRETTTRLTRLERGDEPAPAREAGGGGPPPQTTPDVASRGSGAAGDPARSAGEGPPHPAPPPTLDPAAKQLETRLREAGTEPPTEQELGEDASHLKALRDSGRAVRVGKTLHYHVDVVKQVRRTVESIIETEGQITLARLRDELNTTRKFAQALLEHLDGEHVTLRRPDDSRVLRRRRAKAGRQ